jgi:hypothetical protein
MSKKKKLTKNEKIEKLEKAQKLMEKLYKLKLSKKELKIVSKCSPAFKIKRKKNEEIKGEDEKQQYNIHRFM